MDKLSDFHMALNKALPEIQFTLDILILSLPTGTLETSLCRTSTHSDVVLHSQSNSPVSQKRSCIKALFLGYIPTVSTP